MKKNVALWITGTLACGIFGSFIGEYLTLNGEALGFFGGSFTFICARLWVSETRSKTST